jgi:hypothetical protein
MLSKLRLMDVSSVEGGTLRLLAGLTLLICSDRLAA